MSTMSESKTPQIPLVATTAIVAPPKPAEQREIISILEKELESVHAYIVSTQWYRTWKAYVGLEKVKDAAKNNRKAFRVPKEDRRSLEPEVNKSRDPNKDGGEPASPSSRERRRKQKRTSQDSSQELPDLEKMDQNESNKASHSKMSSSPEMPLSEPTLISPGPVTMDSDNHEQNILIDEKIWMKWIEWFGLADSHQLDRRNFSSQEKYFEVCLFSPYSSIIENPMKILDITETVGYIEIQLRKMYKVPLHKKSRLWVCEKARQARFKLILGRDLQLMMVQSISFNLDRECILALEVATPQGTWPTCVPGDPIGDLTNMTLSQGQVPQDYWLQELTQTVDSVFCGISSELKETADGIVQTAKCVSDLKENDLAKVKDDLEVKVSKHS